MTGPPRFSRLPKEECPDIWIRILPRQRPKSWDKIVDLVVPLERNLCGHLLAGLVGQRQVEEVPCAKGWGQSTNMGMSLRAHEALCILVSSCGRFKNLERSRTSDPCGKFCKKKSSSKIRRHC